MAIEGVCLARKYVDYLAASNEREYAEKRISYETHARMQMITERCQSCDLMDNGKFGDILSECRTDFLRYFVSIRRDTEKASAEKRAQPPVPPPPPPPEGSR